jgi:protocatechuate 3,4-dioxygenase alpha subunit
MLPQTPSQTIGPFFYDALIAEGRGINAVLTQNGARGQRIVITGSVLDGDGVPVPDAMIEIWQADAGGIYNHPADPSHAQADPHFPGFGRSDTRDGGRFSFTTVKPGRVGDQAPHVNVHVFARGMLIHAHTRLYFSDESSNASDPVLAHVPAERRHTLIAQLQPGSGWPTYCGSIVLQGADETVFFAP